MTIKTLGIKRNASEDDLTFFINGEDVSRATHDSLGWDGLIALEEMFKKFSKYLGIEIVEIEPEEYE